MKNHRENREKTPYELTEFVSVRISSLFYPLVIG